MKKFLCLLIFVSCASLVGMKKPVVNDNDLVKLMAYDNKPYNVAVHYARQSKTLKNIIKTVGIAEPILLPDIKIETLHWIFGAIRTNNPNSIKWKDLSHKMLLGITLAVNYLLVDSLFNPAFNACVARIFTEDPWQIKKEKYTEYKATFLNQFPNDLRKEIMRLGGSYLRIGLLRPNSDKLDLASAQIIAYAIAEKIQKLSDLPDYMQQNLNPYATEFLFGPWYRRYWNSAKETTQRYWKWVAGGTAAATGGYLVWKKMKGGARPN